MEKVWPLYKMRVELELGLLSTFKRYKVLIDVLSLPISFVHNPGRSCRTEPSLGGSDSRMDFINGLDDEEEVLIVPRSKLKHLAKTRECEISFRIDRTDNLNNSETHPNEKLKGVQEKTVDLSTIFLNENS
ncbi:conserved hypothetical protein [Ricinus communis]|uniref:Uncharacterized protein n=1 Tax=Ricinus communis TaxID=3988 RepID=B9T0Z9_RICCO|nr:conserved hypothetical protein [Ricinus communis]